MTDPVRREPAQSALAGVLADRILTVPNVLSIVRLVGVPVFLWLLLVEHAYGWALALLLISGATDWLDGMLARLLDQSSALGALLDPFVDRLYVVSTLVGFAAAGILPWWVSVVLIARDAVLAMTLVVYRRRNLAPPDVIYLGKAATFVVMSALPFLLAARVEWAGADLLSPIAVALLVWGIALYLHTGALYLVLALGRVRRIPVAA